MKTIPSRRLWLVTIFIVALSLWLIACDGGSPGGDLAPVNRVEVVTSAGGFTAVASGLLPDRCARLGRTSQRVVRTTIRVTLPMQMTAGTCAQIGSVPFEESIPLRLNGLPAGSYAVEVNGVTASFFLALAEGR